ncbi:hypothetical protein ACQKWADRAFT_290415 [Trichoderma austrokoningii]
MLSNKATCGCIVSFAGLSLRSAGNKPSVECTLPVSWRNLTTWPRYLYCGPLYWNFTRAVLHVLHLWMPLWRLRRLKTKLAEVADLCEADDYLYIFPAPALLAEVIIRELSRLYTNGTDNGAIRLSNLYQLDCIGLLLTTSSQASSCSN